MKQWVLFYDYRGRRYVAVSKRNQAKLTEWGFKAHKDEAGQLATFNSLEALKRHVKQVRKMALGTLKSRRSRYFNPRRRGPHNPMRTPGEVYRDVRTKGLKHYVKRGYQEARTLWRGTGQGNPRAVRGYAHPFRYNSHVMITQAFNEMPSGAQAIVTDPNVVWGKIAVKFLPYGVHKYVPVEILSKHPGSGRRNPRRGPRPHTPKMTLGKVRVRVEPDQDPDTSYLDDIQGREALQSGLLEYFGTWAEAELITAGVVQKIRSGGLWGIEFWSRNQLETKQSRDNLRQEGMGQISELREQLAALGYRTTDKALADRAEWDLDK